MLGFGVKWPLKVPLSPPSLYPPYPSAPGRLKTAELRWNTLFIHLRAPQKRDMRTPHPLRDTKHSSIHKSIHTFIHSGSPRGEGGRERHSENTHFRAELGAQLCVLGLCSSRIRIIRKGRARHCSRNRRSQGLLAPSRLRQWWWRRASARRRRNPCSIAITLHLELNRFHKQKQKQSRAGTGTERPGLGFGARILEQCSDNDCTRWGRCRELFDRRSEWWWCLRSLWWMCEFCEWHVWSESEGSVVTCTSNKHLCSTSWWCALIFDMHWYVAYQSRREWLARLEGRR